MYVIRIHMPCIFFINSLNHFVRFGAQWNATALTWWVDGAVVKRLPAAPFFSQPWPLDVALSFGLRPPLKTDPSSDGFPTTFWVDYVRVWQRDD